MPVSVTAKCKTTSLSVSVCFSTRYNDLTAFRELDSIAHHVHQHLAQSSRIANDLFRNIFEYVIGQLKAFCVEPV